MLTCSRPGGHAAESGQGDGDGHQWSRGLWEAKTETWDPAVPKCSAGAAVWTQSAQRHGQRKKGTVFN